MYRLYSPARSMGSRLREVFFLVGKDEALLWSDASDSPVRLPDSRTRWERIWDRRDRLVEIAHSHPVGPLAFSREDETTMRALVSALGRPILFSVVAPHGMVRRVELLEDTAKSGARSDAYVDDEPWWTSLLREASGMTNRERPTLAMTVNERDIAPFDEKEK